MKSIHGSGIVDFMNSERREFLLELGKQLENLIQSSSDEDLRTFLLDLTVLRGEVNRLFSEESVEGQLLH